MFGIYHFFHLFFLLQCLFVQRIKQVCTVTRLTIPIWNDSLMFRIAFFSFWDRDFFNFWLESEVFVDFFLSLFLVVLFLVEPFFPVFGISLQNTFSYPLNYVLWVNSLNFTRRICAETFTFIPCCLWSILIKINAIKFLSRMFIFQF